MNFNPEVWCVPIYYKDGRTGFATEEIAISIALNQHSFGAFLSPEDQERFLEMAGRKKKTDTKQNTTSALTLLNAIDFVSKAAVASGFDYSFENHIALFNKGAYVSNGLITAYHPIEEELEAIPILSQFETAIKKCGNHVNITNLTNGDLSIQGEKLRVVIPCLSFDSFPQPNPDEQQGEVPNSLKKAFEAVIPLLDENGTKIYETAALLQANSIMSTNGQIAVEYWHGINLPPSLVISKTFMQAVVKVKADIVGMGVSKNSVTVYFENGAWLKSILYQDKFPDLYQFLNVASQPKELPEGFLENCETVSKFNEKGYFRISPGKLSSHAYEGKGASCEQSDFETEKGFDYKLLKKISPYVKTVDFTTYDDRMLFFGGEKENPCRGVLMSIKFDGEAFK